MAALPPWHGLARQAHRRWAAVARAAAAAQPEGGGIGQQVFEASPRTTTGPRSKVTGGWAEVPI